MSEIIQQLQKFGLSEKEAKVYLVCLELGDPSATDISIKSDIPRTLVYDILERLIDRGLASYVVRNNKKYFSAADPKELLRIIKEKEEAIAQALPGLHTLQKLKGVKRPLVEVYEGREGIKTVTNDILRSGAKTIFIYGSSGHSHWLMPSFFSQWHEERIRHKVKLYIIYNDSAAARKRTEEYKTTLKHVRYKFMPVRLESPTTNLIYADRVVLYSWTRNPFAIVMESRDMAENQKLYFKELWKIAKK